MQENIKSQKFGAHEIMECHEVLSSTINAINQFQLYQPYCQDLELKNILQNQLSFMISEYNALVTALKQKVNISGLPEVKTSTTISPSYGVNTGAVPEVPNASINQMNDRDISSGMLGSHKAGAVLKMRASLECTDPQIREMMIQGAKNCGDQAYETWGYMNKNGYYQVPVFDQTTTRAMMNSYQQSSLYNNQQ